MYAAWIVFILDGSQLVSYLNLGLRVRIISFNTQNSEKATQESLRKMCEAQPTDNPVFNDFLGTALKR